MATILAFRVANRRSAQVIGLVLMLAISVVGAVTLVSGDWMTYERLMTLPIAPWAFGCAGLRAAGVRGSLVGSGIAMRVRHQADMAPRADRLPVIKNAVAG